MCSAVREIEQLLHKMIIMRMRMTEMASTSMPLTTTQRMVAPITTHADSIHPDDPPTNNPRHPPPHSHRLRMDETIQACRDASTPQQQAQHWKALEEMIHNLHLLHEEDNESITTTTTTTTTTTILCSKVARTILVEFPYNSSIYSTYMNRCLDACGPIVCLTTCCSLLKELGRGSLSSSSHNQLSSVSTTMDKPTFVTHTMTTTTATATANTNNTTNRLDSSTLPPTEILQSCWSILRRCFLSPPQHHHDHDQEEETDTTHSNNNNHHDHDHRLHRLDRPLIQLLLTVPSLMANACHCCHMKLPRLATSTVFHPTLVECSRRRRRRRRCYCCCCVRRGHQSHDVNDSHDSNDYDYDDDDDDDSYRITLIQTMLGTRNSHAEAIAMGLAKGHHHPLPVSFGTTVVWTGRELGHWILAMLQHHHGAARTTPTTTRTTTSSSSEETDLVLLSCERLLKPSTPECQSLVVNYWIHQTPHVVDSKLCPLIVSLWEQCHCLLSSLQDVVEGWSEWSFCHELSTHKQHFVSLVLLEGLQRWNKHPRKKDSDDDEDSDNDDDALISDLLQGVTHRLESVVPQIRKDGMRIALQVAQRVNQELHFDELSDDDPYDDDKVEAATSTQGQDATPVADVPLAQQQQVSVNDFPSSTPTILRKGKKSKRKPKPVDPDASYDSDDDDDDDDHEESIGGASKDSEDDASTVYDDVLVPYNLDDNEEDLLETPTPLHLLRALELLQTGENDEHAHSNHETALMALPELVRKRPDDLPDAAISLVLQLIRMEDKFGIVDFLKLRQQCIVAICVMEPVLVGKQLTEEAFKEYPLSDRLTCFGALQQAAYELSGSMVLDEKAAIGASASTLLESEKSTDFTSATIEPPAMTRTVQLLTKTRRKRSPRAQGSAIKNNFMPIAPMWFYSILKNFLNEKDDEATWSGSTGSHLLSSVLQTMAVIVEFAGLASGPVLARDLIEFSSSFLDADVSEVRMAVLIAVATSFSFLPDDRILAVLLERGDSLIRTIANVAQTDPDHNCRALASSLSHSFVDASNEGRLLQL